jgi:hypothetical protein
VRLLQEKVESQKLGITKKPRRGAVIRPGTDKPRSREAPRSVKDVVWRHDAGQCAYVAPRREAELIFGPRPRRPRGESGYS